MTYNHDINNLQKNYSPMHADRNRRKFRRSRMADSEYEDQEKEINDSIKYEDDIDAKIREFKEYESTTMVRIYRTDPEKD